MIEFDKKEKKKIKNKLLYSAHLVLKDMSKKYCELISSIFEVYRLDSIIILLPIIKENLKSEDITLLKAIGDLLDSLTLNENEQIEMIENGIIESFFSNKEINEVLFDKI